MKPRIIYGSNFFNRNLVSEKYISSFDDPYIVDSFLIESSFRYVFSELTEKNDLIVIKEVNDINSVLKLINSTFLTSNNINGHSKLIKRPLILITTDCIDGVFLDGRKYTLINLNSLS